MGMRRLARIARPGWVAFFATAGVGIVAPAWAQQAPVAQAPPATEKPTSTAPVHIPVELNQIEPNGLTAEQVGQRAAATSYTAKAADAALRGAAERVDAAWVAFLPRLSVLGRYTRLSDFTAPSLFSVPSGINSVVTTSPPGGPAAPGTLISAAQPDVSFPLVLNNWLMQATLSIPISDYFLRINQNYSAATHAQDAARFDAATARAKSGSDGKVTFYSWLRARGAVIVAAQALNDQRNHLNDAKNQFAVGNASRADVLRAETAVAAAELQVVRSQNFANLTEKQVRVAIHAKEGDRVAPGENIDAPPPAFTGNLPQMTQEALSARFEVKSIDANANAAKQQAEAARAGKYPVLSAFGDGIYANPNPRKFPAAQEWFPTWDVGAQVTWSPNDFASAGHVAADIESRAQQFEAQRGTVRDGIEIEVTQSFQSVQESDVALESTKRQLASATEAYRVARELFNNGRATSTTLTDSETELTRARLDALNATADARIARVRLDHALGRDTRMVNPAP